MSTAYKVLKKMEAQICKNVEKQKGKTTQCYINMNAQQGCSYSQILTDFTQTIDIEYIYHHCL